MVNRLLDRQAHLLEYLSSTATIFGREADAPLDPLLQGIDPAVLRLQARFICNKRLEKIIAVFPRTFEIFDTHRELILQEFVAVSGLTSKSPLANARDFHQFLSVRWERDPPDPAYLADVAACELAMTEVRDVIENHGQPADHVTGVPAAGALRRRPNVAPLRCAHDVRAVFDGGAGKVAPSKRETSLVMTLPSGFRDVRIVEVAPIVVDALKLLNNWIDPMTLGGIGQLGQDELGDLIDQLAMDGFIERER